MAFAYVLDPCLQHQNRAGVNNVHGYFKVYLAGTDDLAETYSDFGGPLNPENIEIDNNGRCVIIADSSHPYRVEMYLPNGDLVYTQEPVWTLASGGGASIIDIESSDASVQIDKATVGGKVTYDLSVSEDDPNRLDWIKCIGAQLVDGIYVPQKSAGTLSMGEKGIALEAEMYYHATVRVKATKNQQRLPYYDEVNVVLGLWDGETTTTIGTCKRIVDYSLGLSQEFEVGADIKVGNLNSQFVISITGQDHQGGDFEIPEVDLHRVYSGVARLPAGVATRAWVNENFQKKLVAGENITIDPVTNTISAAPSEKVQADWTETDPGNPSYIQNKPNLATVATSGSYDDLSNKPAIPDPQVQSDWAESDSSKPDFIKNKPNLAAVATSGDYNDLSNKPSIPEAQVQSDWNEADPSKVDYIKNKPNLATVATSGSYNDLSDKPTIPPGAVVDQHYDPTSENAQSGKAVAEALDSYQALPASTAQDVGKVLQVDSNGNPEWAAGGGQQVQADWDQTDSSAADYIKNKPTIPAAQVQADWNQSNNQAADFIKNKPNLAAVATSGSYDDLTNKPSIPDPQVQADWNVSDSTKADFIKNKPNLATVATSGDYNDLSNKPAIPVQQQADWNQSNSQAVDYIKNKPSNIVTDANYVHTDNNFSNNDKDKLDGIETGAQANVQSDWNQTNNQADDFIKNKPTIPVVPPMKNLVAGNNVTITEDENGVTISADGGPVDQVYDAASSNAQSGVAVAQAVSGKEDEFDAGEGLEFTTDGQGNRVLQVEGPVAIVAGPGIVIDNPDGNTLRVSQAHPTDETVLWTVPSGSANANGYSIVLSETIHNFEEIAVYCKCTRIADSLQATTKNVYPVCDAGFTMFADGISTNKWNDDNTQNGHYTCGIDIRLSGTTGYIGENYRWGIQNGASTWETLRISGNSIYPHPYKIVGIKRVANN